jgi:hypothetical protein
MAPRPGARGDAAFGGVAPAIEHLPGPLERNDRSPAGAAPAHGERETPASDALDISAIRVGQRHRKDMGDIGRLAANIADVGLLHPVVVTPDMPAHCRRASHTSL